ncbi:MAG: MYPU_1760 family metalloprotease [Metamycoplasmataceae bacterium]
MKNNFKHLFKKIFNIFLIFISLGAIGISIYQIINVFVAKNTKIVTIEGEPFAKKKDENTPVTLVEYSYQVTNDNKPIYFLGEKGLNLLNEKIKKDLQFGPEIEQLKTIYFNRKSYVKSSLGSYYPRTYEMDINIDVFSDLFNLNLSDEEKVDLLFPTIYHEYFHHFANMYLTNISNNEKTMGIFLNNREGFIPKLFLNKWLEDLNFDNDLIKIQDTFINNPATKYTNKELFEIANSDKQNFEKGVYNIANMFPVSEEDLKYYFSFSEIFTRKWQQISYIPNYNSNILDWYGYSIANKKNFNSYVIELARNRVFYISKNKNISELSWKTANLSVLDDPYGGVVNYLEDGEKVNKSFDNSVKSLTELYRDISGYGSPISQVFLENNLKVIKYEDGFLTTGNLLNNKIKLSGYLPSKDILNLKSILVDDKNDSKIENYKEILINKPNYNYFNLSSHENPFSSSLDPIDNYYSSYITKNFIDASIILNKNLYFWIDKNMDNIKDLNEIVLIQNNDRSNLLMNYRPISTFQTHLSNINNYYYISNKNNGLILTK